MIVILFGLINYISHFSLNPLKEVLRQFPRVYSVGSNALCLSFEPHCLCSVPAVVPDKENFQGVSVFYAPSLDLHHQVLPSSSDAAA